MKITSGMELTGDQSVFTNDLKEYITQNLFINLHN